MAESIGQRVTRLREAKKFSITQLAKLGQFSRQTQEQNEKDLRLPSVKILNAWSRVLKVSTDYILHGDAAHSVAPAAHSVAPAAHSVAPAAHSVDAIASLRGLAASMCEDASKQEWIALIELWATGFEARNRRSK